MASTTFAVYLIHANRMTIDYIYNPFHPEALYNYPLIAAFYMIPCGIIIFSICSIMELLRVKYVERPIMTFIENKYSNKTT